MVFGNLGKMAELMKQAKAMKDEMSKARYEAEAGGVKVVMNGEMEILELRVPPGTGENVIKDAVNRALKAAKDGAAKSLQKLTGGMPLPPGLM